MENTPSKEFFGRLRVLIVALAADISLNYGQLGSYSSFGLLEGGGRTCKYDFADFEAILFHIYHFFDVSLDNAHHFARYEAMTLKCDVSRGSGFEVCIRVTLAGHPLVHFFRGQIEPARKKVAFCDRTVPNPYSFELANFD